MLYCIKSVTQPTDYGFIIVVTSYDVINKMIELYRIFVLLLYTVDQIVSLWILADVCIYETGMLINKTYILFIYIYIYIISTFIAPW